MKYKLSELKHMNGWILSNVIVFAVFALYSVFLSDYTLSNLAPSASLTLGGVALYHFCGLLWMAAMYERLDNKMVYISAVVALLAWHFGFWSYHADLITSLVASATDFTPPFHLLNVQTALMYVYLTGWGTVCYKATKKNAPDLKMLALSGGVLLAIILGYHLIGFWSVFAPANHYITSVDGAVLPSLMNLDKETLLARCNMIDGVDCFRFAMSEGYPKELLNYNSNFVDSIKFFATDPMTQKETFHHTFVYRDAFFVDTDAQHYSRTFFFDQGDGIVNYSISNYLSDLPVNILSFISWMTLGAVVFWQWFVLGVGIEHSSRLTPRARKQVSVKEWALMAFTVLIVSLLLGFAGIDHFLGDHPSLMLVALGAIAAALFWFKMKKTLVFLGSALILSLPATYIYVSGLAEQYKSFEVYDIFAIQAFSFDALLYTAVFTVLFVAFVAPFFKERMAHMPEVAWTMVIFVACASFYTFIGSHFVFPAMIADSEQIRLDNLMATGQPFVEFCKAFPFDVCLTVNQPDWKAEYFKPLMNSTWFMVTSGIIVFAGAFYTLTAYSHNQKNH